MVSKIFSTVQKKYTNISEAAIVISVFTLFSQFLGVVRDRLFAHFIGPGRELDIYLTAFRIPDFLYIILSTLISATVLIPLLSQSYNLEKENGNESDSNINTLFTIFMSFTLILSIIVFLAMPFIVLFIAPGFDGESLHRLVFLSRIMLISPIILAASNFIGSINQFYKKFFAYALAPVFYNIGIIIGISFFYKKIGLIGLGVGVLCGAIFHLATQLIAYSNSEYKLSLVRVKDIEILKKVLSISIPRTLTLSLFNLLLIIITALASKFQEGSISLINFSFNIALVPLSLVGIPFATAAFPYLVSIHKTDIQSFRLLIEKTISKIIFWSMTLVVIFSLLRAHIVRVILGTKLFSWNDTRITAALVFILLLSVVFQGITNFFIRVNYAQSKTKTPFKIVLIGFICTLVVLSLVNYIPEGYGTFLVKKILRITDVENTRIILLAFAYTIGAIITSILFVYTYQRQSKHKIANTIIIEFFKNMGHALVLAILFKINLYTFEFLIQTKTTLGVLLQAGISSIISVFLWFIYLYFIKSPHVSIVTAKIKLFFGSHKFILEENQDL